MTLEASSPTPAAVASAVPPAVRVAGLSHDYGSRRALAGVSFTVDPGEIFGFLGPNGGGKSTLFRALATLAPIQEGRVEILGHDLSRERRRVRRLLGVVFQSPSVDVHLTVEENLRHQGHLHGLWGRGLALRIVEGLDRFGLAERRRERVGTLSGGLRRRVEIAKALLHRPRLLLLDEPSSGLDPGARRDLWAALESERRRGATVLLTTHFIEEGDRCDRLALLDGGRLVAAGTPAALKASVGGEVVTIEAADAEEVAAELARRLDVETRVRDGRVRFEHARGHELVPRLAEDFPRQIRAVTVALPTLEDAFLKRTGHDLSERDG